MICVHGPPHSGRCGAGSRGGNAHRASRVRALPGGRATLRPLPVCGFHVTEPRRPVEPFPDGLEAAPPAPGAACPGDFSPLAKDFHHLRATDTHLLRARARWVLVDAAMKVVVMVPGEPGSGEGPCTPEPLGSWGVPFLLCPTCVGVAACYAGGASWGSCSGGHRRPLWMPGLHRGPWRGGSGPICGSQSLEGW